MNVVILSDASFANANGLNNQFVYVILLAEKRRKVNVAHDGLSRFHRVTRSVMPAEGHALILAFDLE